MSVVDTPYRRHEDNRLEQILACLRRLAPTDDEPGITSRAVATAMGLKSLGHVRLYLAELQRQGRITDVGGGGNGHRSFWRVAGQASSAEPATLEEDAALIRRLGGGAAVARLLGIGRTNVTHWACVGIPRHHRATLRKRVERMSPGERALVEAFADLAPGQSIEYWRGVLAKGQAAPGMDLPAGAKTARAWAQEMERTGRASLSQRRNGPDDYSYLAIKLPGQDEAAP